MTRVCKASHRDEGTKTKFEPCEVVKTAEKGAQAVGAKGAGCQFLGRSVWYVVYKSS